MPCIGLNDAVAFLIKERRAGLGISQEQLADLAGLDRTYISSVERHRRNLTLRTLERIIPHLGLSPTQFLALIAKRLDERNA